MHGLRRIREPLQRLGRQLGGALGPAASGIARTTRSMGFRTLLVVGNVAILLVLVAFGAGLATMHFRNADGVGELSQSLQQIGDRLTAVTTEQQPFVIAASRLQAQVLDMQLELIQVTTSQFVPGSYLRDKAEQLATATDSFDVGFLDEATQFRINDLQTQIANYSSLIARIPEARSIGQAQTMAHRALGLGDQLIAVSAAVEQQIFEFINDSNAQSLQLANEAGEAGEHIAGRVKSAATTEVIAFAVILVAILLLTALIRAAVARPLRHVSAAIRELAQGNLTERMAVRGDDEIAQMARELNAAIDEVGRIVRQVRDAVGEVTAGSQDLLGFAERLSSNAHAQAVALEETSASLEQLTVTVRENASRSEEARGLAGANLEQAQKGGDVVAQAIAAMNRIHETSSTIAENTSAIQQIAFQTKLLALNASVEAAHAGEHGRGFGVVATEVRRLASRSRGTATTISGLVGDAVARADEGTRLADESGAMLESIVRSSAKVTEIIASISTAGKEQSSGLEQIDSAVHEMNEMTQQLGEQIDTVARHARSYAALADRLQQLVRRFRIDQGEGGETPAPEAPTAAPAPVAPVG